MEAGDAAEPKRRSNYKQEWQRAQRAARAAAGRCVICGKPRETDESTRQSCEACAEKASLRAKAKAKAARIQREQEVTEAREGPGAPFCPHCNGRDLLKAGHIYGKQRYRCRECGRWSYGVAPTPKEVRFPCPNPGCGGSCWKQGRDDRGRQRYTCPKCGRRNTGLWPTEVKSPGGPFPHVRTFNISLMAQRRLNDYCQRHGMSEAQAVRQIFREWADEPRRAMAAGRHPLPRLVMPREALPARLPDLRSEATRARMRAGGRRHYSVLVVQLLGVALDDKAYQGLLRFMRKTGLNHQAAARLMIVKA